MHTVKLFRSMDINWHVVSWLFFSTIFTFTAFHISVQHFYKSSGKHMIVYRPKCYWQAGHSRREKNIEPFWAINSFWKSLCYAVFKSHSGILLEDIIVNKQDALMCLLTGTPHQLVLFMLNHTFKQVLLQCMLKAHCFTHFTMEFVLCWVGFPHQ